MDTLNYSYDKFCKPGYTSYEKVSKNFLLIENFFEDFENAKNFFINRDKWECTSYQDTSKPGYESCFPNWIGKSLLEKFLLTNQIFCEKGGYEITCNFFYDKEYVWSLSNSGYCPHNDCFQDIDDDVLMYICLINLNNVSVSTKFYSYKTHRYCDSKLKCEWENYIKNLNDELYVHYNKKIINKNDVILFLQNKKNLDFTLTDKIEYKPNQAIIYPACLFHSSNITEEFTKENPRTLLRICFFAKNIDKINKKGVKYK